MSYNPEEFAFRIFMRFKKIWIEDLKIRNPYITLLKY